MSRSRRKTPSCKNRHRAWGKKSCRQPQRSENKESMGRISDSYDYWVDPRCQYREIPYESQQFYYMRWKCWIKKFFDTRYPHLCRYTENPNIIDAQKVAFFKYSVEEYKRALRK